MIMDSGKLEQYSDDNKLHSVFLEKYGMVSFAVRRGNSMLLSVLNKTIKNNVCFKILQCCVYV